MVGSNTRMQVKVAVFFVSLFQEIHVVYIWYTELGGNRVWLVSAAGLVISTRKQPHHQGELAMNRRGRI